MTQLEAEQEVKVKIPDDEPVVIKVDDAAEGRAVEKKPNEPDEREVALTDLRKQLDEQKANALRERQAREQAEHLARERETEAKTAKSEVQDSNLRVIINAIDAAEQGATNAERSYADAMAAGDYSAAAKAQRTMAQSEAQLLQLKNGKAALEDKLAARPVEGRVDDPRQSISPTASPGDPVETLAARLTPKSAAWLREHPTAAGQVSKLTAAHNAAVELEGIPVESPEYFAYIEQRLGMGDRPAATKQRSNAMASAPVSSSGSSGSLRSGGMITLSPSEVEMAINFEPDLSRDKALESYARSKMALMKEGKLS